MTNIIAGNKMIKVYMGHWNDGSGYGPDETGDLLGSAYDRYDDEHNAIVITGTVEEFIEWAHEWERGEDEWTKQTLQESIGYDTDLEDFIRMHIESRSVDISDPEDI